MSGSRGPARVLGVLGGMGPAATAEFMRLLAERSPASCDQEHATVYILSDPQMPDRSSAIVGKGEDPTARLRRGLTTLVRWGADLLAVPCNTAHYFIDRFRGDLPVPLVHIVEETVAAAADLSPGGAWLAGTLGTIKTGLFQAEAERLGYQFLLPPEGALDEVQRVIDTVKGGDRRAGGVLLRRILDDLWSARDIPLCMACTELPLAYDASGLPADRAVSSLEALSDACIRALYAPAGS